MSLDARQAHAPALTELRVDGGASENNLLHFAQHRYLA